MNTSRIPAALCRHTQTNGLFAVIESRRVVLPLKGVECDFSVVSGVAEVLITQIFRQENANPLDCEYLFPLPSDASVYWCEADINGRTIRARVKERNEARQLAAQKKAEGYRTALVEAERENLFTLSLGNVQPDDLVVIQLRYFQTLRSLAGMPSMEIPFCPGVRYIPGSPLLRSNRGRGIVDDTDEVPDASRITPVRIDAQHPDAAYMDVRGTLDSQFIEAKDLLSPSHEIVVQKNGDRLQVTLSNKGAVPDQDFVLRWKEKNVAAVTSRAWIRSKENESYALLEIRAPKETPEERASADFYFLMDRSGSMAGEKWNKAVEALQSCVSVLGPADRAMVTFFESHYQDFAEAPLKACDVARDPQFQAIQRLGTGGGTELRSALQHVLAVAAKHSAHRLKNLILITDAQIGNESGIMEMMKSAPDFPVHCFGIDVALNDSLLLALCRQQGGTFHSLNPRDDIAQAVTALGQTLAQPVLLDLELANGWELADSTIPNLYASQVHYLSARSSSGKPLELRAQSATSQPIQIQFDSRATLLEAPYLHWCRSRIQRFLGESKTDGAVQLSVESNLICGLTAFIAWDESEKVPIASHELVQPALACGGALMDMQLGVAGLRGDAPAQRAPRTMQRSLFQRLVGRAEPDTLANLREEEKPNEIELRRELSDVCYKAGLPDWQDLVKAVFDWIAQAKDDEKSRRVVALKHLIEALKVEVQRTAMSRNGKPAEQAETEAFRQLLRDFMGQLTVR